MGRRNAGAGPAAAAACTTLIALLASLDAQQAPSGPPKALVPVAASTVSMNPDPYYGEWVTMTAYVDQILSPSTFAVEQRTVAGAAKAPAAAKNVLVIAPFLNGPVDPHAYVTVMGEVVKFDPEQIAQKAKNYKLDLPSALVEQYRGRPAVIASSVINKAMVDLAKRLPPPMTAEEQAFSTVMKKVGPSFTALRTAVDGSNADTTKESTAVLKQAFTDAEAFWKTRNKADAIGWTQDARKQVESIERDAIAGKWDAVKTAAGTLGQACQTCHGAYRERFDDGSYRIKTGS